MLSKPVLLIQHLTENELVSHIYDLWTSVLHAQDWAVGEGHQERAVKTGKLPGKLGWQCTLLPTDVA